MRLTTLLHHVTVDALRWAFFELKQGAAAGADGMTWRMYEEGLEGRLADLYDRVHSGVYRATPSRRVNIPKPDGGTRPLGVAAIEDKIVRKVVAETILTPIYEAKFLGFSYGFRPGRGAHNALDALAVGIDRRKINWVVDCDIRNFFDTVSRDWLVRFLEHRIGDKRVTRLIIKWLNAGVMEDGEWRDDLRGTPQGSVASPILANVYMHYVLDLWFQKKWRSHGVSGDTIIVRYADDFVVGFRRNWDAERFLDTVKERFERFDLALHPDKTRLIEFGRYATRDCRKRGQGRPETFDFLGLTHYCTETRRGNFMLGRKPVAKRVRRTLKRIKEALRRRRHDPVEGTARWLGRVVDGWLNYYAVPTSLRFLHRFIRSLRWLWWRTMRRRSQKGPLRFGRCRQAISDLLAQAEYPTPVAGSTLCRQCDPREEPDALAGLSGFVRGAPGNRRPYRDRSWPSPPQCARRRRKRFLIPSEQCFAAVANYAQIGRIVFGPGALKLHCAPPIIGVRPCPM